MQKSMTSVPQATTITTGLNLHYSAALTRVILGHVMIITIPNTMAIRVIPDIKATQNT